MSPRQPLIPFLWFETQAEEAARYYVSLFPRARMREVTRIPAGGRGPEGSVMTASFELDGQTLVALNGNRRHAFSPALSLLYTCANREEADRLTESLSEGGQKQPGGWLLDRYGVSWQVHAAN